MRARALLGLALSAAVLACSAESGPDEWHVAPFLARGPHWRPEKSTFILPQKKPAMLIYEVTRYPGREPSDEQRAAADDLVRRSHEAALRHGWYDFEKGLADGFELVFADEVHYVSPEFLFDDAILDPDRPEFLMYYDTPSGKRFVGFMFYVRSAEERGPQVGGPLTVWHYHVWARAHCYEDGMLPVAMPNARGVCPQGQPTHRSPEMIHVWLIDHPQGHFATRMRLEPEILERLAEEPLP